MTQTVAQIEEEISEIWLKANEFSKSVRISKDFFYGCFAGLMKEIGAYNFELFDDGAMIMFRCSDIDWVVTNGCFRGSSVYIPQYFQNSNVNNVIVSNMILIKPFSNVRGQLTMGIVK